MIFHIYSAIGRTGSFRIKNLLSKNHKEYHLGEKVTMPDPDEEHFVHHCHSLNITPVPEAIHILSTRASKKDAALSKILSGLWNAWHIGDKYPDVIEPIMADEEKYLDLCWQMIKCEKQYIKMYDPIIIYLEDSIESIEAKISKRIGKPFKIPHPEADEKYINIYPAKDYIINYKELPEYRDGTLPRIAPNKYTILEKLILPTIPPSQ